MSEYYGSEGFDRPRRRTCTHTAMTGLGRERLNPWYDMGYVFVCVCVCLCVFVCVLSSGCLVCRPSDLCVCRVGTPPAR